MGATPVARTWAEGLADLSLLGAFLFVAALFVLGAQPGAGEVFPNPWDKAAHFTAFGALAALVWLGDKGRRPLLALLVAVALGGVDELRQFALPGRNPAWADFLTDTAGSLAAVAALGRFVGRRAWKNNRTQSPAGDGGEPHAS